MASNEHNDLAYLALTWLANKVTGKGVRATTEVSVGRGYVADAVALCSLQNRFNQYYNPRASDTVNYYACIFEAKAARADFVSTFNDTPKHRNRHIPVGSLHWCVTKRKMIKPDELPSFWGLLEEYGSGLTEIRKPQVNQLTDAEFDSFAHKLLWPVQARRNSIVCAGCGRWTTEAYCKQCAKFPLFPENL